MTAILTLTASLLVLAQAHSFGDPGRDPCKITENGYGLTCSNITSDFYTSSMFFSLNDDIDRFTGEVKYLEIRQSNLTNLLKGSFKHMPHLSHFVASNVSLKEIDSRAFEGLHHLKMADLSLNELKEMPVQTFKNTPIKHLSLEGNSHIRVPTNGPIIEARRLTSLVLKRCNIQHLPTSAFTKVLGLIHLDLSENRLEMLPRTVFSILEHLDFVDLSRNLFVTIDFDVFTSLPLYPNYPRSVILAGNPWSCDCRISDLISWVTKSGSTWTTNRLRIRTNCHGPEDLNGISWNDSRLRQHLLACKSFKYSSNSSK